MEGLEANPVVPLGTVLITRYFVPGPERMFRPLLATTLYGQYCVAAALACTPEAAIPAPLNVIAAADNKPTTRAVLMICPCPSGPDRAPLTRRDRPGFTIPPRGVPHRG